MKEKYSHNEKEMPMKSRAKGVSEKMSVAHSGSIKMRHPDKGAPIIEGKNAYHYDKGYVSDDEYFNPPRPEEGNDYRGNEYMDLQNEAVRRDTAKGKRNKFTKIA